MCAKVPTAPEILPDAQIFGGGFEALVIPPGFLIPDGELEAESDGLGVHAVRAADLHGVLEFKCAALENVAQLFDPRHRECASLAKLQRLRGIHHVGRRHAVVEPARCFGVSRRGHRSRRPRS